MNKDASEPVKNLPASVRQRLTNLAKTRGIELQRVLVLYSQERLLYRLSVSPFADHFILKGASLFSLRTNKARSLYWAPGGPWRENE